MATKNKFAGFKRVELETYWIPVELLKTSQFQPEGRDSRANLKLLFQSIEINGYWDSELIQITPTFYVINGHRRLAAAKLKGIEKVPCIVIRDNPAKRFSWLNDTQKPLTSRETMVSVLRGNKIVTPKHKKQIDMVRLVLGEQGLAYLYSKKASHRVIHYARELARYLSRDESDITVLEKNTRWLVDHKMQYHVRDHIWVRHTPPEVIAYYVDNNLPMIAGHPVIIQSEQEQQPTPLTLDNAV